MFDPPWAGWSMLLVHHGESNPSGALVSYLSKKPLKMIGSGPHVHAPVLDTPKSKDLPDVSHLASHAGKLRNSSQGALGAVLNQPYPLVL